MRAHSWNWILGLTIAVTACAGDEEEPLPPFPTEVTPGLIAVGMEHACILNDDWTVRCWGAGSPGDPVDTQPYWGQATPPEGARFRFLVAGDHHTCGLTHDGMVECWGYNRNGQLDAPDGPFASITAGSRGTCALRADGTRECWGSFLFDDTADARYSEFSLGGLMACGVSVEGEVVCTRTGRVAPAEQGVSDIDAGSDCACGLRNDGSVVCWGNACMDMPPSTSMVQVGVALSGACGATSDGRLACWGGWAVVPQRNDVLSLAVGYAGGCVLTHDARVDCWTIAGGLGLLTPPAELQAAP